MTEPANAGDHVQLQLGVYVLGDLPPAEIIAVEDHLGECTACAIEAAELFEVVHALGQLSDADRNGIVDEFGRAEDIDEAGLRRPVPATARSPSLPAVKPDKPARPGGSTRPEGPTRPSNAPRWGSARDGRRPRLIAVTAAVIVALVAGVGIGQWLTTSSPVPITLAGRGTDASSGVVMSVSVNAKESSSQIEATVTGLRPGVAYRIYAVDTQGQTQVVEEWVNESERHSYLGTINVHIDELAFFTLTRTDGSVIVTVRMARSDQDGAPDRDQAP